MPPFDTKRLSVVRDGIAPDGSDVRVLLALGGGITYYSADYASLGYLLLIVGLLRLLNTFYDLQRGDDLKRSLKDMDEKFGGSKEQHRAPLRRNESA